MITPAKDVDHWMTQVPEERQEALARIRALITKHMPAATESLQYKMPCYTQGEKAEIAFNSQKHFIALYIMKHAVMLANAERLKDVDCGKGCLRFPNPNKIDWDLVEHLIRESAASDGEAC